MPSKLTIALLLFIAGGFFFFFHPLPSCGFYLNLFLVQVCLQAIQIFGFDPNFLTGALFVLAGILVMIFMREE